MNNDDALFPKVQDFINFETLLSGAQQAISDYASQSWSNTDEHDPGITLLQAMCYNTSDLAYRSSLPLTDLLTPPSSELGEGIFPERFGPHQALTCGPVSEDDYRRALLDLQGESGGVPYFYFSNVKLVREPEDVRYHYNYNEYFRAYSFAPLDTGVSVEQTLLGNYHLYVQPSRETVAADDGSAHAALDVFLRDHRNVGEAVSRIIWLTPADIMVGAVIELQDDVDTSSIPVIASILAAIYTVTESYITPPANRASTEQLRSKGLSNEDIYQGPYLQHGWIAQLPAALSPVDPVSVNLARLVNTLLAVEGVKCVQSLGIDSLDGNWLWSASPGCYPRLWGDEPLERLAEGELIVLKARGISYTVSAADIRGQLVPLPSIENPPVTLPYGRWRNPADYHPFTNKLPPCYGVLQLPATPEQIQLHQFMLTFEQLLANDCHQLALLPDSLAFNRDSDYTAWGAQWPFSEPSVSDEVFEEYSDEIKLYLEQSSKDPIKELSCVDHLLSYFNSGKAPSTFAVKPSDFMGSQQGYLSEITRLMYQRANVRLDKVSALQQRITARLGIGGGGSFNEDVPLDSLPFYLVEHRALLPTYPNNDYDNLQITISRRVDIFADLQYLTLVMPEYILLDVGRLIDLVVTDELDNDQFIYALMINRVDHDANSVSIKVSGNEQLRRNLERVLNGNNTVKWRNCPVWLKDMDYPLVYAADKGEQADNEKWLTSSALSPYPAMVQPNDRLIVKLNSATTGDSSSSLTLEVIQTDEINNLLKVKIIGGGDFPSEANSRYYFWYFDSSTHASRDRFSFVVSLVFNRDQLGLTPGDLHATNAWMKDIIAQELPCHVSMMMHWLPEDQFRNFGRTYALWQNSGAVLSDFSYDLLRTLTLGYLPRAPGGIGAMFIASADQKIEVVGDSGLDWNIARINELQLFYVPFDVSGA